MRTPRSFFTLICGLALLASAASAAEPKNRPVVPDLVVGSESSKSFIVEGAFRPAGKDGFVFQIVCDGEKQFSCIYGVSDRVPLLISNGNTTLFYDFVSERIKFHPSCYIGGGFPLNKAKDGLLAQLGFKTKNEKNKAKMLGPEICLNMLFEQFDFTTATAADGTITYSSTGERKLIVKLDPREKNSFQFVQKLEDDDSPFLEIKARLINQPIPAELFKFPDHTKFPKQLNVVEMEDHRGIEGAVNSFREMEYYFVKFSLMLSSDEEFLKEMLPNEDVAGLLKRDAKFGKLYRQALAAQGIELREILKPTVDMKEAKSK